MNQIEALKLVHFIARQDGPSADDLRHFGETDTELLAFADRRDKALEIIEQMIVTRYRQKNRATRKNLTP